MTLGHQGCWHRHFLLAGEVRGGGVPSTASEISRACVQGPRGRSYEVAVCPHTHLTSVQRWLKLDSILGQHWFVYTFP